MSLKQRLSLAYIVRKQTDHGDENKIVLKGEGLDYVSSWKLEVKFPPDVPIPEEFKEALGRKPGDKCQLIIGSIEYQQPLTDDDEPPSES